MLRGFASSWGERYGVHAMAWLAENIQSVFFLPPAGTFPDAAQVFEKVAGCAPDAYQRPVGGGPLSPSNAHGVIDGHAFTVSAQAGRIDVVLFGQPGESGPPQEITNVSAAIVVAQRIWVGLLDWLQVNRVSFVLNLIQLAANDEEVKALLEEAIPQVPLVGEPVDFSYSCNVRRQFDVDAALQLARAVPRQGRHFIFRRHRCRGFPYPIARF